MTLCLCVHILSSYTMTMTILLMVPLYYMRMYRIVRAFLIEEQKIVKAVLRQRQRAEKQQAATK
jgi:hypothetical protein